jgi:diacylglycerol kinase (ATP)
MPRQPRQPSDRAAVIINPISGTGGRPEVARRRAELAAALMSRSGVAGDIFVTERPGHARDLAQAVLAQGVSLVVAWGGDGTVNEVASALAFRDAALAIVPSGSGNGLARELAIPFDPPAAFAVALGGADRVIDAGELDGRLFFNIAGLGLDARVAHQFAAHGLVRRGFVRYLEIAAREIFTFEPCEYTIVADTVRVHSRAMIVAIANGRQYGNGALIAPAARLDDGRLDVVVVDHRSLFAILRQVPKLFRGTLGQVDGVRMLTASTVEVTSADQVLYHVDGEPFVGGATIHAQIRPSALRVRVPQP